MNKPPSELLPPEEIERLWNDPKELMRWTIEQLEGDEPDAERHSQYRVFCALVQKDDLEGLKRMLAKHPEDAPDAILRYAKHTFLKHGQGRPKRKVTAADFMRNTDLWFAAIDVYRLVRIWKEGLGKRNRTKYPTRFDIAAKRRRGLKSNQVKTYFTKNQYRYRRQKP
jgi:hypothetical protein